MKRRRAVQLVALSGLSLPLAGCTDEAAQDGNETDDANEADDVDGNETDTDSDDADVEDEDGETEEDEDEEPDPQEFSGTGSDAIEEVEIEDGLTVVDATYEGEDDFEVRLIPEEYLEDDDGERDGAGEDENGNEDAETDETTEDTGDDQADDTDETEEDDETDDDDLRTLFVNSSESYTGQTAHHLEDGTYVLSVVADGEWDVTVLQPRDTSGDEPPISISGDGNEVHGPFEFDGTYEPSGEFDGERINVNVRAPTGESDDDDDGNDKFVFHEDSIATPSEFEYEGVGYVAVKSDGEWSVDIE